LNNVDFVSRTKRYAVDDTVEMIMKSLRSPRIMSAKTKNADPIGQGVSEWMEKRSREEQRRSEWFKRLSADDQLILRNILVGCAEMTAASIFTFLDGVGGDSEGVFEIVEVVGDERTTLNPENSEMLHDLFSEVCEQERGR
jgi:hypothetical protein